MTPAEAVETSVTSSFSQDYSNLEDLPCADSLGFKQFALQFRILIELLK